METDAITFYDGGRRGTLFFIDFGKHVFEAGVDKFRMALTVYLKFSIILFLDCTKST